MFFFHDSSYCDCWIKVGLVCDGYYNTADMNLYKINNVYFPDEGYFNTNQFPDEWMEIFDD